VNENRKKLSKRDESVLQFIEQYQNLGYLPEALFNFIALLGWSPVGEEEIFSEEEFIKIFDPSRLSSAPAMFDKQKLTWINNRYIKELSLEKVVEISLPHLVKAGFVKEERTAEENKWVTDLVSLYQDQMSYGAEIVELSSLFFKDQLTFGEEEQAVINEEQVKEVLTALVTELEATEEFTVDSIKASIKNVQKATGQKGKKLFMPIRVATTGQCHGPELPNSMTLLGKEKVIARLNQIIG
jgi:nondiscriminating glutamyl-tRNA synthetase